MAQRTVINTAYKENSAPAALARPLLPVQQMVRQTYLTVGYHAGDLRRLGAMPLAIVIGVQTLYLLSPTLANLVFATFGNLLASSAFAVGLNRLILQNQRPSTFGIQLGRREWGFFGMMLLTIAPLFLLTLALFGGGLMLARAAGIEPVWHIAIIGGISACLLLTSFIAVRFSLLFPSYALDRPINMRGALKQTHNQSRRIWLGLLLCLAPSMIMTGLLMTAALAYKMPVWAVELIHAAGMVSALPLGVVFLALNYERLVLGRIVNRDYAVLPKQGRSRHHKSMRGNSALMRRMTAPFILLQRLVLFSLGVMILCLKSIQAKMTRPRLQSPAKKSVRKPMRQQARKAVPNSKAAPRATLNSTARPEARAKANPQQPRPHSANRPARPRPAAAPVTNDNKQGAPVIEEPATARPVIQQRRRSAARGGHRAYPQNLNELLK